MKRELSINKIFHKIKILICIIEPFKILIFFSLISLLGIEYSNSQESSLYVNTMVIIFGISILFFIIQKFKNNFTTNFLFIFIFFVSIFIQGLIALLGSNGPSIALNYLYFFIVFSSGSILWGAEIGQYFNYYKDKILKWVELIVFIVYLNLLITIFIPLILNTPLIYNSSNYQTASYYSAFSFGVLVYYLLYGKNIDRFIIFKGRFYNNLLPFIMLALAICVIAPGGRGAFVLLFSYILVGTFLWFRKNNNYQRGFLRAVIILLIFIFTLIIIIKETNIIERLGGGFGRAIEYIDWNNKSLDLEGGSSGRDVAYKIAWENIKQKPILGYGFFKFMDLNGYPHNIDRKSVV